MVFAWNWNIENSYCARNPRKHYVKFRKKFLSVMKVLYVRGRLGLLSWCGVGCMCINLYADAPKESTCGRWLPILFLTNEMKKGMIFKACVWGTAHCRARRRWSFLMTGGGGGYRWCPSRLKSVIRDVQRMRALSPKHALPSQLTVTN